MKDLRVLIADDTTFMRSTIQRMLAKHEIKTVYEAINGKEAVNKYKNKRPDLVIMDISMPVMDGIEAIRHIRSFDPEANVIICSLQGQRNNVMDGIKAGAKSFLVKPVKEEKLINEISKIFKGVIIKKDKGNDLLEEMTESMEDVKASLDYLNGVEEGYLECKKEITVNMFRNGIAPDLIRMCVDLTEEEMLSYKKEFNLE